MSDDAYHALTCVTTSQRPQNMRRYLPHYAQAAIADPRYALVVALDGDDGDTRRFCEEWGVAVLFSTRREGVSLSKNRVLERFAGYDYYFFIEDDAELVDAATFDAHVQIATASGIHHFSSFERGGVREVTGTSTVAGRRVVHGMYGGGQFSFYTGDGLRQVGGWHPRFAEFRRWGHTEHSYRFYRAGLAPAPFNVIEELCDDLIWHHPPPVTRVAGVAMDKDEIAAPERELIEEELRHYPVTTLAPYTVAGDPARPPARLAALLDGRDRYPLVSGSERRECVSGYQFGRFLAARTFTSRARALTAAAVSWPSNPELRHMLKTTLSS